MQKAYRCILMSAFASSLLQWYSKLHGRQGRCRARPRWPNPSPRGGHVAPEDDFGAALEFSIARVTGIQGGQERV